MRFLLLICTVVIIQLMSYDLFANQSYELRMVKASLSTAFEVQQVSSSTILARDLFVEAETSNSTAMRIGPSSINSSSGFELVPGAQVILSNVVGNSRKYSNVSLGSLPLFDLQDIYFVGSSTGDSINIMYVETVQ